MTLKDFVQGFFKKEEKTVPAVDSINEIGRGGGHKELTSNFLYKPPYGYPRYIDVEAIRNLATSPVVDMAVNAVVDEIGSVPWDIVGEDDWGNPTEPSQGEIEHVKSFFENPNTNHESWEQLVRKVVRDVLEIDAGVLIKVFNKAGELVELTVRDGATFTKNPDIHGMFTFRDDIIFERYIYNLEDTSEHQKIMSEYSQGELINSFEARHRAAYFQYGWRTGSRPIPFGKKEIVWFEKNARSDDFYGRSPLMVLYETVQTLIYAIQHNLDYFKDNSIPLGTLGLEGASTEEVKAFKEQWEAQQMRKDDLGRWKKVFHKLPIVNRVPTFTKFGFSNSELQLLEGQKWWSKLVWGCFGVTPTELGFTDEAKGMSNQIVQSNVFKKRAINPILRMLEYHVNKQIIPEFGYQNIKFRYQGFDVDEEMKKTQLYKLQTDTGIKTVNEIRQELGMENVPWGDDDPKRGNDNNFSFWDTPGGNEETRKKEESKPNEKALNAGEGNPLILREGEEPDEEKLKEGMIYLMKEKGKEIIDLIQSQRTKDQLEGIKQKGIVDVAKAVKRIFSMKEIKNLSDKTIQEKYMKGWEGAEKQLDMNVLINKSALEFLQKHTFDNILDMSEEIKNDLRAELERGIINGEGVTKLTKRVNKVFDVNESRAEAIARTETARSEGQGRLQAFKSSGVGNIKKKWVTHYDNRTTELCKRLDGQVVGIDENFKDKQTGWEGAANPAHVNCRSTVAYIVEDEE